MKHLALIGAAILLATVPARAQEAAPTPSPELLGAALQAAIAQRDQALADALRSSAQLAVAQREIARLRQDPATAPPPAPKP